MRTDLQTPDFPARDTAMLETAVSRCRQQSAWLMSLLFFGRHRCRFAASTPL
jgi:hypothetical protein